MVTDYSILLIMWILMDRALLLICEVRFETILRRKKEVYQAFCEGDIENHLLNMRRDGYWGTNLELIAFSGLMIINIHTSLDQDHPEFEINYPHNTGEINIFKEIGETMRGFKCMKMSNYLSYLFKKK